jgi:hypothetical protein
MKRSWWLSLALLLVYTALLIGAQFHTHAAGTGQFAAHCKSCHVTQTVYDSVQTKEFWIPQIILGKVESDSPVFVYHDLQEIPSGRSPPLS